MPAFGEDVEQKEASCTTHKKDQPLGKSALFTKAEPVFCDPVIHTWAYIQQKQVLCT